MGGQVDQPGDPVISHRHQRLTAKAVVSAVVVCPDLSVHLRSTSGVERHPRHQLDAPAQAVAAVLRAVGSANHLDRPQVGDVIQVEEAVDASACRRVREADPIDVTDDLRSGQPPHEDRPDTWAGSLQLQAWLVLRHLRRHRHRPLLQLPLLDDVDLLRRLIERLHHSNLRRHCHLGDQRRRSQLNLDRRHAFRRNPDRRAFRLQPAQSANQQLVGSRRRSTQ